MSDEKMKWFEICAQCKEQRPWSWIVELPDKTWHCRTCLWKIPYQAKIDPERGRYLTEEEKRMIYMRKKRARLKREEEERKRSTKNAS